MLEQTREHTCVNLFRVTIKDTPGNQVKWVDENGKIYNSIFTFKKNTNRRKMADLFERKIICKERNAIDMSY